MSLAIGLVRSVVPLGKLSVVYLVVVLFAATRLGRGPALVASIVAFLTYDFFFTTPYHELTISDPDEWVSLTLFLLTALITGQIAANERARAEEARRGEREAILLFDVIRMMSDPDIGRALQALAGRVRGALEVDAVAIDLSVAGEPRNASAGDANALAVLRETTPTDIFAELSEPAAAPSGRMRRWVHVLPPRRAHTYSVLGGWRRYAIPVRVGEKQIGRITLLRRAARSGFGPVDDRSLSFIATHLGLLSERAELEAAVTEAEVLRRASDLKSALLNAVSHELRTPLASIIAAAGSLLQRDVRWDPDDRDAFASDIEQQAQRLDRVVGDLLDLSRMESGALRPAKDLHEVGSLVDDVIAHLRDRTSHRIVTHVPEDLPPAALDRVEIEHVIANLIDNAQKYAPPGTTIEVRARQERDDLVIEVSDEGPGVPAAAAPFVFEPFFRARGPGSPGGLGLGLAVARGLVSAHDGRIWVRPREGGGAVFGFAIPSAARRATVVA